LIESFAKIAAVLVIAYLLGSIPTALIVSKRILRMDIRSIGNGNMGARNTFHEIGPVLGILVAVIDYLKGAASVFIAYALGLSLGWQMLAGIFAILGHDFPVFARFKGGKGVATSLGTMAVLYPVPAFIGLAVYSLVFLFTRKSLIGLGIGGTVKKIV
jgi:glycerol-3-phosphate acyltransferase PlsY